MSMRPLTTALTALVIALSGAVLLPTFAQTAGAVPNVPSVRDAAPSVADAALEQRLQRIADELRCLVCQNETIAASQAALAVDLRAQIREQLRAGRDELQIRDYMVSRYGDFILYRPPWRASTMALWLGPFVLLALALWVMHSLLRANAASTSYPAKAASTDGVLAAADDEAAAEQRGLALLQATTQRDAGATR
ncbi:MAG: cytochrome c-type biogenesis protein CcmH [Burkholderiaceae bacterium]